MTKIILNLFFLIMLSISLKSSATVDTVKVNAIDYVHYNASLTPDFKDKSVRGSVNITFLVKDKNVTQLSFSAQYKRIYSVKIKNISTSYQIKSEQLVVTLKEALKVGKPYILTVEYKATPEQGMKFYDDHLFTVYHTKNWLVSHNAIADKASFELFLTHDAQLSSVGNGKLMSKHVMPDNKVTSHWLNDSPMPVYTFGFALGEFEEVNTTYNNSTLSYLYRETSTSDLTSKQIKDTFVDVPDMIGFFENIAGFSLPSNDYQYVVVEGYMAQEATSFSLVGEEFVHTVLGDKNENWFIAHELAHEWWGNSITCANFSHFWLNEGLVQFLVAVYKQHRFGEAAYKKEIEVAIARVNRAMNKGNVSPVAFKQEIEEHNINRTMAYSKGALVFYMLRNELGEDLFWQALKDYSTKHKNGSVTTNDLKLAFEAVSRKNLTKFFSRWVYGDDIPEFIIKGKKH